MTTLSVSGLRRKAKPAPVRSTVVLFDATQRHPAPDDFGQGILRRPTAYDRHIDMLAALAEAQDRLERGCLL
jgi:hypothetical protein